MTLRVYLARAPSIQEEGAFWEHLAQEPHPCQLEQVPVTQDPPSSLGALAFAALPGPALVALQPRGQWARRGRGLSLSLSPATSHRCQGGQRRCRLRTTYARTHSSPRGPWDLLWAPQESMPTFAPSHCLGLAPTCPHYCPGVQASPPLRPWCFARLQATGTGSHPETDPEGASPSPEWSPGELTSPQRKGSHVIPGSHSHGDWLMQRTEAASQEKGVGGWVSGGGCDTKSKSFDLDKFPLEPRTVSCGEFWDRRTKLGAVASR